MKKISFILIGLLNSLLLTSQVDLQQGLIANYPFSGSADDVSGNNHHGTVYNAVLTSDRFGQASSAYYFDGDGDYIDCGNFETSANIKSISCWFKTSDYQMDQEIVSKSYLNNGVELLIYGEELSYFVMGGSDVWVGEPFSSNNWVHVVGTHDGPGSTMKLYINGVLIDTETAPSVIVDAAKLLIGNWNQGDMPRFFYGAIDDVRIYNRPLNQSEVLELYTEGNYMLGLLAYYPFSGNANDVSGNNHHGTVFNATLTTDRFGNTNSAYYFDGDGDYIDCGTFVPAESMKTICCWVKPMDITSADQEIVSKSILHNGVEVLIYGGEMSYFVMNNDGDSVINTNLVLNQWVFISATHDGPNSPMKLYVNGVLVAEKTTPVTITNAAKLFIGDWCDTDIRRYFNGVIDEVRIFNRPLNASEVLMLYNGIASVQNINSEAMPYVYPNPADDVLFIDSDQALEIQIFNLNGKLVLKQQLLNRQIDISGLPAGIYILEVQDDDLTEQIKFVKQ